ncbi:hypothetical protein JTB14_035333 [Gonioctena quinquepunctata]|nr:hypothetical protein JTB14_035333 [Gonioctena quinquepunctata]
MAESLTIFYQESADLIVTEVDKLEEQVVPTQMILHDTEVMVKPTLIFCLIDGKNCYAVADACEKSAVLFASSGEDLTVAKLLVHEVEEDNKDENLEEEIHLQEDIDISEPGPSGASQRK